MNTDELELFERIKQGDEIAFESLFKNYYASLCFFSNKIVKDTVVSEEIVQDIFYHFWEKRITITFTLSIKSYLFKAAYNNSLKYLRHQKIIQEHENHVKSLDNNVQLPDNYAEVGEMMYIINRTLTQVPEKTREIFELNRYEGLKYHEIAEKMNISIKTVEAHMSSLLKTFRINLKDYLPIIIVLLFLFF